MSIAKARTLLAKYQGLSNASEFIRSHGEEGFSFEDKKFNDVYMRENQKLSERLNREAMVFWKKYLELGIDVESEIDDNY
jgi:hypothetical protein